MAHNGGRKLRSVSGRNNRRPSGKNRDNWRIHKLVRIARIKRRLARIARRKDSLK